MAMAMTTVEMADVMGAGMVTDSGPWSDELLVIFDRWQREGKGIALYRNVELGHPECGHQQAMTFGDERCQIEDAEPPDRMPDIGGQINWRYRLWAVVPVGDNGDAEIRYPG